MIQIAKFGVEDILQQRPCYCKW